MGTAIRTAISTVAGVIALTVLATPAAWAQQSPARIDPQAVQRAQQQIQRIDPSRLQLRDAIAQRTQPDAQQFPGAAGYVQRADDAPWLGWVNFNRSGEPPVIGGMDISRSYEDLAGGVRFGFGARRAPTLMLCRDGATTCGADGAPSGGHVMRVAENVLRIDFARPTVAVTMMATPDWARDVRAEVFVIEGWADGDTMLVEQVFAPSRPVTGESWVRLTLSAQPRQTTAAAAPATTEAVEFDFVVIRALNANGGPVNAPFLIDDLRFADQFGPAALDDLGPRAGGLDPMLDDTGRLARNLQRDAETIREGGLRNNAIYPAARRIRMAIDYEAAQQGASAQREFVDAQISLPTALGRAEDVSVPILAPLGAFADENPRSELAEGVGFMGRPDFYHLILPTELGEAVITGTRLATPTRQGAHDMGTLAIGRGYGGANASFNLYGASYAVRLSCEGSDLAEPCNAPEELEALLERLFLFIPPEEDQR